MRRTERGPISPTSRDPESDRRAIHEVVLRYCRAVDRLDLEGVRAAYADVGVDHHTGFSGTADAFVAWLAEVLPRLDGTMHLIGNHLCELHGDEAVVETYGTAVHWGEPAEDPSLNFTSGFRYVDHFVRTEDGWKILERFAVREWTHSDVGRRVPPSADGPRGQRGPGDPLWVVQGRMCSAAAGGEHPSQP